MSSIKFPTEFPRIKTKRLLLREITHDDRQGMFLNYSNEDISKWFFETPLTKIDQVDDVTKVFIDTFNLGSRLTWAILLNDRI